MIQVLSFLLFSFSASASSEISQFSILPGKFHSGGKAAAAVVSTNYSKKTMKVRFDYQVIKKPLVPIAFQYFKGSKSEVLPLEFMDERGFLNLEHSKTLDLPNAKLFYIKRASVGTHKRGHHILIKAKNGQSDINLYYHPNLPGLGWGEIHLIFKTALPVMKTYEITATLVE